MGIQHHALWFHVDMDAFFASVEQRDNPEYRGKPLMVGALPGKRGVISTCSYEARVYGIHSAMPVSEAFRLCPHGCYITPDFAKYQADSRMVMNILQSFTPDMIQVSIDEAFMNMKGTEGLWGKPSDAARLVKKRIHESTGLTASVGVASSKFCAKLASDYSKPDGLTIIPEGSEEEFICNLPVHKLWGVGKKTVERLSFFGLDSIQKIKELSEPGIQRLIGKSAGTYMYNIIRGIDPGIYENTVSNHSISNEITFEKDVTDSSVIEDILLGLSNQILFRLREENFKSQVLVLKIRLNDFTTMNVQKKMDSFFSSIEDTFRIAVGLLKKKWDFKTPVRLIGLGFADLVKNENNQGELFELDNHRRSLVEETVLDIKNRYPGIKITKARLVDSHLNVNKKNS